MLADRPRVAQVVVGLDEAVEERLLAPAADLAAIQRPDRRQSALDRLPAKQRHRFRPPVLGHVVRRGPPLGRELDMALPVKEKHQASGDHVPGSPVGLDPVPGLAQLDRKGPVAGFAILGWAISCRMKAMSEGLTVRPRYRILSVFRPPERARRQPLLTKPETLAVVDQDLQGRAPARHEDRPRDAWALRWLFRQ